MGVTNAENEKPLEFKSVVSRNLQGVSVLDYVIYFNTDSNLLSEVKFELTQDKQGVFVAGLSPGSWVVEKDENEILKLEIDAQAKSIYLPKADKGEYTLRVIT
ncbi:hypothetical protein WJR50_30605 [Catalinimonas sp. 4WD22]|uniref:hypothetical protein n=1 Tax=Catalinimonas locisalis TaxID=3133978 RepID=UPI003101564F